MKQEHENLMRTLKDQQQIRDCIRCRIGWHRWCAWSDPVKVVIDWQQRRFCADCNVIEIREIKTRYG